jgi:cyclomaltodextrinase / maltogenic alpha-amylase / neopullulanase
MQAIKSILLLLCACYLLLLGCNQQNHSVKTPVEKPFYPVPEWAKTAIWYQIFVERFRNGDRSNDPTR